MFAIVFTVFPFAFAFAFALGLAWSKMVRAIAIAQVAVWIVDRLL